MSIGSFVALPNMVVDAVCEAWAVPRADIYSQRRHTRVVEARWVIWYICRAITSLSFPELGIEFGKDHTSVMHGVRKITERMGEDLDLRKKVAMVVTYVEQERNRKWQTTNSEKSTTSSAQRLA